LTQYEPEEVMIRTSSSVH